MLFSTSYIWFWRFVTDEALRIAASLKGATTHQCRKSQAAEVRAVSFVLEERLQRKRLSRARFARSFSHSAGGKQVTQVVPTTASIWDIDCVPPPVASLTVYTLTKFQLHSHSFSFKI